MTQTGYSLLQDPLKNKGTAFSREERTRYGLSGLLPDTVETLETQVLRINEQVDHFEHPINKYVYLLQLLDNNETLFFKTIMQDPAKFMPLVYTPTVGEACQQFGHILRRPRGMYISINDRGNIKTILQNWPSRDVRFTVVTDGERILGLGDLGVCGMGIPIGKLCLYTACAGVPPEYTLPVVLDAGTNNESFLDDPLYPGSRQKRVRGQAFDDFIAEFVQAINEVFPKVCIQWEDFAGVDAVRILNTYKTSICTFNDDVQGTAGVATAGLLAASRFSGKQLKEQVFLFLGAGAAAVGIANLLVMKLVADGMDREEAFRHFRMFDINGLLVKSRNDLADYQKPFAHEGEPIHDFVSAIHELRPTAIIGVSTIGGAFNRQVVETMSAINERPIIFPFSNPTAHSECTAEQAYTWSKGKAIFASGSPFGPVRYNDRTFIPGQGNNVYIFPAMGLAIFATEARTITDELFIVAAEALAEQVTEENFASGLIYPPVDAILEVSVNVAVKMAESIFDRGLARVNRPENIGSFVRSKMYRAVYKELE